MMLILMFYSVGIQNSGVRIQTPGPPKTVTKEDEIGVLFKPQSTQRTQRFLCLLECFKRFLLNGLGKTNFSYTT